MIKHLFVACIVGIFALSGVVVAGAQTPTGPAPTEVRVGALLDLSGDGKTLGLASQAALEVAAEEIEEESDGEVAVELDIRDTGLDPATASSELQSLLDSGIRVVIGPQTSSEVRATIDQVNAAGALMISHGSTASSLSFPDDGVFRMVPDDRVEAAATADLIGKRGQSTVVTVHRNDPGNNGLVDSLGSALPPDSTTVVGPVYEPDTTDFSDTVAGLEASIEEATSTAEGETAVYLAGFEEVAELFAAAATLALAEVPWYGGDGSARGQAIIDDEDAAAFAAEVDGFASPLLILSKKVLKNAADTIDEIEERSGEAPDAFALAAYDALQLAVEALADPNAEGPALRTAFVEAADGYAGITGTIELNDAGDRSTGSFAFYAVCESDGEFEWEKVGSWTPPKEEGKPGKIKDAGC
ncbi:MAG TPA: ABC transporter substrate-binding protein [Acidimicrobiia bacterium]|nr:ABC transporter substrate-binding protein [Acidimicrobiia bacterium]